MKLEHAGDDVFLLPHGDEHEALRRTAIKALCYYASKVGEALSSTETDVLGEFLALTSDWPPRKVKMSVREARIFSTTLEESNLRFDLPEPEVTIAQNAILKIRADLGLEV